MLGRLFLCPYSQTFLHIQESSGYTIRVKQAYGQTPPTFAAYDFGLAGS